MRNKEDLLIKDLLLEEMAIELLEQRESLRNDAKKNIETLQSEKRKTYKRRRERKLRYTKKSVVETELKHPSRDSPRPQKFPSRVQIEAFHWKGVIFTQDVPTGQTVNTDCQGRFIQHHLCSYATETSTFIAKQSLHQVAENPLGDMSPKISISLCNGCRENLETPSLAI
ncbi:hypothetical protein TNCV_3820121 [Trichonephila clavipes]|uniref:Uncharacterized protein n=1 Tax=Trichonephila clavipes TaxID=2585209 RepID=A0A8X6RCV2_TRICX|nr:hypothetical protein TNCV_3820121 [Trichonephila clavipes]